MHVEMQPPFRGRHGSFAKDIVAYNATQLSFTIDVHPPCYTSSQTVFHNLISSRLSVRWSSSLS